MHPLLKAVFSASFAASILRVTTPILFASLGAVVADLSGVVNIALEGMMLIGAAVAFYLLRVIRLPILALAALLVGANLLLI